MCLSLMKGIDMNSLGIYIHIPFCIQKCLYCDFLSFPEGRERQALYFDALKKEIEMSSDECRGYVVDTVFFGGGTPTSVDAAYISDIMKLLRDNFSIADDAEITIECNPGTADIDAFKTYKEFGINRLSIGLQSPNNEELKKLGRIHDLSQFEKCYHEAIEAGFSNINVDLMSALPGQSLSDWEKNLKYVCALEPRPKHISAYSLIIEEGTPFYNMYGDTDAADRSAEKDSGLYQNTDENTDGIQLNADENTNGIQLKKDALPDEDTERDMYHCTDPILKEYGYHRYEISNYACDGSECRHNIRYWKCEDYIGFGLGAASLVRGVRYHNTEDINRYIEAFGIDSRIDHSDKDNQNKVLSASNEQNSNAAYVPDENNPIMAIREDIDVLDKQAQMEEFMFMGLRLVSGVTASDFESRFGQKIEEVYANALFESSEEQLLIREGDQIHLTEKGLDLSNYCMAKFLF